MIFPEGTTALASDDAQRSLSKIVQILNGGGGGGFGIGSLTGVGNPNGVVTGNIGQMYTDQTTDQVWVNNDGAKGWGP